VIDRPAAPHLETEKLDASRVGLYGLRVPASSPRTARTGTSFPSFPEEPEYVRARYGLGLSRSAAPIHRLGLQC
jgi:hypothetical protein